MIGFMSLQSKVLLHMSVYESSGSSFVTSHKQAKNRHNLLGIFHFLARRGYVSLDLRITLFTKNRKFFHIALMQNNTNIMGEWETLSCCARQGAAVGERGGLMARSLCDKHPPS
jgi:hypothetical protein